MTTRTIPSSAEQWLKPREAAARLGITTQTLGRWVRARRIESNRDASGRRLYTRAEVDRVLTALTEAGQ